MFWLGAEVHNRNTIGEGSRLAFGYVYVTCLSIWRTSAMILEPHTLRI
jgi:hypothetical protein